MTTARDEILGRIRHALDGAPEGTGDIAREYLDVHVDDGDDIVRLLADNLTDYRAHVHRAADDSAVAGIVARLLNEHSGPRVVVPEGLTESWIPATAEPVRDDPPLDGRALDGADAVLTGCALAIAETGTIVLDSGPGQGRRALTLAPDHHVCVVHTRSRLVASVPRALARLDPARPLTWIAGPSATSDIELDRVEGVHGPRRLDVILLDA
jgi:L-lactate dehydrogenase complex protein LldG